eukprot:8890740-Pyramimonas_sp.AAC.1
MAALQATSQQKKLPKGFLQGPPPRGSNPSFPNGFCEVSGRPACSVSRRCKPVPEVPKTAPLRFQRLPTVPHDSTRGHPGG